MVELALVLYLKHVFPLEPSKFCFGFAKMLLF